MFKMTNVVMAALAGAATQPPELGMKRALSIGAGSLILIGLSGAPAAASASAASEAPAATAPSIAAQADCAASKVRTVSNESAKAAFNRTSCTGAKKWTFRGYVKHKPNSSDLFTHAQVRIRVMNSTNVAYKKYFNTGSLKDFRISIKLKYEHVLVDVRGYLNTDWGKYYGKWSGSESVHR
ncbi:hypothetical protein [Nonomuraea sp. B19D2]|uniref:hypothetical protein n=1 Tax=Nonomuraea sp. B19D2 TaxID=3159561 RepID=UPI0032DA1FB3